MPWPVPTSAPACAWPSPPIRTSHHHTNRHSATHLFRDALITSTQEIRDRGRARDTKSRSKNGDCMDDNNAADIYYVDTRNADPRATVTAGRPQVVVAARQPAYQPAAPRVTYAGPAYNTATAPFFPQGWGSQQPVYMQPPVWGGQPSLGSLLGGGLNGVNIGSLIDLIGP